MRDISTNVTGETRHADLGNGTVNANRAEREPHGLLEVREGILSEGPRFLIFVGCSLQPIGPSLRVCFGQSPGIFYTLYGLFFFITYPLP